MGLMSFLNNIKASIDDNSSMSVGGVSLLISSFIGFLLGLTMCFVLAYDVTTNGYVKTDLTELGIFLLCSGGYIAGSGIPKTIVDSRLNAKAKNLNNNAIDEDLNDADKLQRKQDKNDNEP